MAKKKIYAVRKGKVQGLFETWDACRASIDGYPGAEYKGFSTKEEALAYLNDAAATHHHLPVLSQERTENQVLAYVDGSFDVKTGRYAYGCVLLLPDGGIVRRSGSGDNPESAALRNVTGEMLGAMNAIKWCRENGFASIKICYDYSGIEMWAMGQWRAKTDLTKKYAEYMQKNASVMNITFQKIKAHTGDQYNEEADRLAKAALRNEKE